MSINKAEPIVIEGYAFDQSFIDKLNRKLRFSQAFSFKKFINNSKNSYLILMKDLMKSLDNKRPFEKPEIDSTEEEDVVNLIVDFFTKLNKDLGKKVKTILTHKDPDYRVNLDATDSYTGTRDIENFMRLHLNVQKSNNLIYLETVAHEMGHALSAHHIEMLKLRQKEKASKNFVNKKVNKFILQNFHYQNRKHEHDSMGEIESFIMEKMFVRYLIKEQYVNSHYLEEYNTNREVALKNDINLISYETSILEFMEKNQLKTPILLENFNQIAKNEENNPLFYQTMFCLKDMAEEDRRFSKYKFRYVIGEIVSSAWMNVYDTSTNLEKRKMIDKFLQYLTKTDKLNLEQASKFLTDKSIKENFENYALYLTRKSALNV